MRVFTRLPMRDWRDTARSAQEAEALGFDAVMTVELGHDVFAPLAVAAPPAQGLRACDAMTSFRDSIH